MDIRSPKRRAIGTAAVAGIIVVIVVVAGVAGYFLLTGTGPVATSSTTTTSSTTSSTSSTNPAVAQYLSGLPNYYPANYSTILQNAMQEGKLVIYASFVQGNFGPVVAAFQQKYPFIQVQWVNMPSATTLTRYQQEQGAGKPTTDIVLNNSPADSYNVAINQSQAIRYCSPEQSYFPANLNAKCQVFSPLLSFQVFMVNTAKVPKSQMPTGWVSLDNLVKANSSFWNGKVGGYNFGVAVTGLPPAYSLKYGQSTVLSWFTTLKQYSGYQQFTSAALAGGEVVSGQLYCALGALAILEPLHEQAPTTTQIVFPSEGTYGYPAQMFITKAAANPYAAMLFVDFYLSQVGQGVQLAAYYASARTDLPAQISKFTYANIQNLTAGAIVFDTFPPSYNATYADSVDKAWTQAMSSG